MSRKVDSLGIVQEIKIWPYWQVEERDKIEFVQENETHKILWNTDKPKDYWPEEKNFSTENKRKRKERE